MYQFSLDSYMVLFENSIKKSGKNKELHQRLYNMNIYHTYAVYQNTCRGLFEVHKLLFSFQICISLLMANSLITTIEIEFLLKGGNVLNKESQTENPCPCNFFLFKLYLKNKLILRKIFFLTKSLVTIFKLG